LNATSTVFDFATSCNYVTLSLSMHTGCPMHIQFCAIISSIFYVCDIIVVEICPYKVANLQQEFQVELGIFVFTTIRHNDIRVDPRSLLVPTSWH